WTSPGRWAHPLRAHRTPCGRLRIEAASNGAALFWVTERAWVGTVRRRAARTSRLGPPRGSVGSAIAILGNQVPAPVGTRTRAIVFQCRLRVGAAAVVLPAHHQIVAGAHLPHVAAQGHV